MKLGNKITLAAAVAVLATTIAAVITVYVIAQRNRVQELKALMQSTLDQAERMRDKMEVLHGSQAIDMKALSQREKVANGGRPLREIYEKTTLFDTIPVASAWAPIKEVAKQHHLKFFTPSAPGLQPRNPKNVPGAESEKVFQAFATNATEYFSFDRSHGELVLGRPVRMTANCLICHGEAKASPTGDGLDYLGFPMEGMKAGDLKGAFILVAPMSSDPVVLSSMATISIVGLVVLVLVVAGFFVLNQRMIIEPLNKAIAYIGASGEQTAQAAAEISQASNNLAEGASEQAASLEETSASLEEMAGVVKQNSENAAKAKDLATQARSAADTGSQDMQAMIAAMGEIKSASDGIAKIIKAIDEIAFQTNILALNAAVEAARAGEAGLGFAVVADEVRNLAQRSAQAAKETADKIEDSIAKSENGVQISAKVEHSLQQIVERVRKMDELMAEIAAASKEQSQGIEQVNIAVSEMDKVTQTNAATAEESASASTELSAQAAALHTATNDLKVMVGGESKPGGVQPETARAPRPESPRPTQPVLPVGKSKSGIASAQSAPVSTPRASRPEDSAPAKGDFRDF